jgi:hypothetical protein
MFSTTPFTYTLWNSAKRIYLSDAEKTGVKISNVTFGRMRENKHFSLVFGCTIEKFQMIISLNVLQIGEETKRASHQIKIKCRNWFDTFPVPMCKSIFF